MIQDAIPGALKLGFDEQKVRKLYDEMEEFGKYSLKATAQIMNKCLKLLSKQLI